MLNGDDVIKVGNKYLVVKWKKGFKTNGEASSQISSYSGSGVYKRYHSGLENGLVSSNKNDSDFDLLQKYGLKKYEVPAILKEGEAVLNQEQIKNLGSALRAIQVTPSTYLPMDYTKLLKRDTNTNNTISIGEIHLHEVNDVDGLSKAIIRELPGKLNQAMNRR